LNRNLQPGIHPDADKLSVFIEGAATAREQDWMLAHLAECGECRKAVFLMQPHEEIERATATPVKGWVWRRLVPIGLPAAAIACGVIAVFVYIRPRGAAPPNPQQIASIRQPEIEHPRTTIAPTTNSERVAQSGGPQSSFAPGAAATDVSRRKNLAAGGSNLPAPKKKTAQATANVAASETTAGAPSSSVPAAEAARVPSSNGTVTASNLPLNGRNFAQLQQLQPADKDAASQNTLAKEKELPALQIQAASAQNEMLAGISGRITDRTGAVIAGVTVTLRDAAGKTRQSTTGTDGSFHLMQLPAGQYELTATASGFKKSQQSIELKPSELAMLRPVLDVGAVTETVEVEAGAVSVQTESASVGRVIAVPSGLPVASTASHGKRLLSLDSAGNLFLSRNGGKKWKKVKPQWADKAIRVELTSGSVSDDAQKPKDEASGAAGGGAVFLLTTDGGTVWSSKDGGRWHQQ
jgi:hypothetical protein